MNTPPSWSYGAPDPSSPLRFVALAPASVEPVADERLVAIGPEPAATSPDFAIQALATAAERPDVALFYGDDVVLGGSTPRLNLKPDFDRALLRSQDYVGPAVVVRAAALRRLQGLRPQMGTAALYDLLLRADADGMPIAAIRSVLTAYRPDRPAPSLAERRAALEQACATAGGPRLVLPGMTPQSLRLRERFADPPEVTLVTPTAQAREDQADGEGRAHIVALLESLASSTWPHARLRVLIGDDVPSAEIYGDLRRFPFAVERLVTCRPEGAPFNYAAKMNRLWRAARTEHLVLLNDDLRVVAPDWLEALMSLAVDREVGGVGARLLYPSGAVQHAGMAGGPFGLFIHAWIGQPADQPTYGDWALVQRDWSAVTGAVFATRRSALEAVNGFDEGFALEYNDVDLCLRLKLAGYRIVQAPDALLVHHEKASRGNTAPPGRQTALFLRRWGQVIADDPAYHPGLSRDSFVIQPAPAGGGWYESLSKT